MALSRIWSAFIIVSILVATVRCIAWPADRGIFSQMVTGHAGDTLAIGPKTIPSGSGSMADQSQTGSQIQTGDKTQTATKIQTADGLIETCKTAVNLSIGLIGI